METSVEEREELMVSPFANSTPTLRTAHFLKPTVSSIEGLTSLQAPFTCSSSLQSTKRQPVKVDFNGWRNPEPAWKSWVDHMKGKYESVWEKAGIYEAIVSSTFSVQRSDRLIIGIAEKWCPQTNTFVFPWGEASITLEDLIILGGYSASGSLVLSCYTPYTVGKEQKEVEGKLEEARKEISRGSTGRSSQRTWIKRFMDSGSKIEHEAFLSFWLDGFVFPDSGRTVANRVFPIAINLAKGNRIALAPAVLASIYRDLSLLKATIISAENDVGYGVLSVSLWSPFQLVQLWVWERFPALQPKPNSINNGDPRSALWDHAKGLKIMNVRSSLAEAGETFRWQPYAMVLKNWQFPKFYSEEEQWQNLNSSDELLSFALCLRQSELVGLGCIEQYLPHRVAMQFGLDQDVPGHVARSNESLEMSLLNYIRPFTHPKLYLPRRSLVPCLTVRYLEWWKQSVLGIRDVLKDAINGLVRRKRSLRKRLKLVPMALIEKKADRNANDILDFPPEYNRMVMRLEDLGEDVKPTAEMLRACVPKKTLAERPSNDVKPLSYQAQSPSNAEAYDGGLKEIYSMAKPIDGSVRALEDTNVGKSRIIVCGIPSTKRSVDGNSVYKFDVLESRICGLERDVAKVKAARVARRLARDATK